MKIGQTTLEGVSYHFGRSARGYMTRLHFDANDAIAEGAWLDGQWEVCRLFWEEFFEGRSERAEKHAKITLLDMMNAVQKGLRPLRDSECPDGISLFLSEGQGEEPRILVRQGDVFLAEFEGSSYSEISERLNATLRSPAPLPPGRLPGT